MAQSSRPLESYSPAYRRRLERAAASGLSRQAARGHRAAEHVTRAERARAAGRPTSAEIERVKRTLRAVNEQVERTGQHQRYVREINIDRAILAMRQSPIIKEELLAAVEVRRQILAETRKAGFAGFGPNADTEFAASFAHVPYVTRAWFWYH